MHSIQNLTAPFQNRQTSTNESQDLIRWRGVLNQSAAMLPESNAL